MRQALSCILFVSLTLTLVGVSQAWGRLTVSPSLAVRQDYNDNIYLEKDGEEDFITTVAPTLSASLKTRSLHLDLTYGFVFRLHSNESELDETEPGDSQRALAKMDLFPDRDFTVNVLDEFKRVVVDERRPTIEENVVVNRTNFNRFLVNPRYRYRRWQTFTATLGYEYENRSYDNPVGSDAGTGDDSDRHGGRLELEKRFSEKLSASSGYLHTDYRSPTAEDYRSDDFYIGFVHKPGPKLTLDIQGGVTIIDRAEDGDRTERLIGISADYSLTEEIFIGLSYDETIYDSVSFGLVRGRAAKVSFGHNRRISTEASVSYREDDYLDTDREDSTIGVSVQTTVPLRNRISIRVRPYVTWLEYEPEDDHALRYGFGLSVQRDFRYGLLRFGYDHHASENDELFDDYRNNIVFLEAALSWGGSAKQAPGIAPSTPGRRNR